MSDVVDARKTVPRSSAARSAIGLTAFGLLGPAAGLAVEVLLAWRFGVSEVVDAYRVSATLPLFAQQVFLLQVLPNIVVPAFAAHRAHGDLAGAWRQALQAGGTFVLLTAIVSAAIFAYPQPLVGLLAPGLGDETRGIACFLVRWFALTLVPTAWCGVAAGILNAHGIFWLPAAGQVVSNGILLLGILAAGRDHGPAGLALGVVAGAGVNAVLFTWRLLPLGRGYLSTAAPTTRAAPELPSALASAPPLLGSVLMSQWYGIIFIRLLSGLPPGTLAEFSYAWRAGQLVTLLPTSLATVLFPRFADAAASERGAQTIATRAVRMALFLALPLAAVLLVERGPMVSLLFERGRFSLESLEAVARLFAVLVTALPAGVVYTYAEKILYAEKRAWTPLLIVSGNVLLLLVTASDVVEHRGAIGLAVLAVVTSWTAAIAGLFALSLREVVPLPRIVAYGVGLAPLAIAAAALGGRLGSSIAALTPGAALSHIVSLGVAAVAAGLGFLVACRLLRIPEAEQVWRELAFQRESRIWGRVTG